MNENKLSKRLTVGVILLIVLTLCLCATTSALVYSMLSVESNLFKTGKISIDLNGGKPLIADDLHLEPGIAVEKEFYIQNNSTDSVYYKLYFTNVEGGLAEVITIRILYGETELYSGTAASLTREAVAAADDLLSLGEKRTLTALFFLPVGTDNAVQNGYLSFDLCADAVQSKNNPDRNFD